LEAIKDRAERSGDKDEKTRLECERLRVMIEREKIELDTAAGKLVCMADVVSEWKGVASSFRAIVDSWAQHNGAKYPDMKTEIEIMAKDLRQRIASLK
jgi:phage terminase Nu1 subunit (DNA packaging protein)